jgi:hypothetical protein
MDLNYEPEWVLLEEVYNPDEAQLITGLLNMANIPVKIERDAAGELYGLTIGPLAQIRIMVPGVQLLDARQILAGEITEEE